ncbi:hypothetical protein HPB50_009632 [Hyalomma asiaticum]|uniref:Uncharacterized protein n=1 Tax=Hyalomma asiaticum TaxID=266040 RepID=A0ACB7TFG4_HYAAI|nr:hypothetical protein HPB50_009632 [Hyalomma asiaticum]
MGRCFVLSFGATCEHVHLESATACIVTCTTAHLSPIPKGNQYTHQPPSCSTKFMGRTCFFSCGVRSLSGGMPVCGFLPVVLFARTVASTTAGLIVSPFLVADLRRGTASSL